MTRYYLVEVPGDHPLDAEDLGELEAFAVDRLHAEATVTQMPCGALTARRER